MGPFDGLTAAQRQQIREAHATRKIAAARTGRGTCRFCGNDYRLNKDGTVRGHVNRDSRRDCVGSGLRPEAG